MEQEDFAVESKEKDAAKLSRIQSNNFKPRAPSIASEAQDIFRRASAGSQAALEASKFGDPTIAFLQGAFAAGGAPGSAQEIENAVVSREIEASQQALMQSSIMDFAPDQVQQASEFFGADLSGMTVGQFQAIQPMMKDAAKAKQQDAIKAKQQPLELEDAMSMAASYTSDPEKQKKVAKGIVAGNMNGEQARHSLNSIFRVGVAQGQLGVSQKKQALTQALSTIDEDNLAITLATFREDFEKNPLLRKQLVEMAKKGGLREDQLKFVQDVYGTREEIGLKGDEARLTEKDRAKNRNDMRIEAEKFNERMVNLKETFLQERARLTPEERELWEPIFGAKLPANLRAINIKQLAQASRISSATAKSRSNAIQGMEMAEKLMDRLQGASRSEVFLSTMEGGAIGDGLRAVSDKFFDTNTTEIELAKEELQDVITRMRTGAALNNQEIEHYGGLVIKWAADPKRNMMTVKTFHEFFRRVEEDIRRGRRIPGRIVDANGNKIPRDERTRDDGGKGDSIILSPGDFDSYENRSDGGSSSGTSTPPSQAGFSKESRSELEGLRKRKAERDAASKKESK